jgi:hypothetical protein
MEDDMYDNAKFKSLKQDLVYSLLAKPEGQVSKADVEFLKRLIAYAVFCGMIEEENVESAIESSGLYDLPPEDQLISLGWMRYTGSHYLGELSFQQETELRRLHELCMLLTRHGELSVLREIADMIE